MVAAGAGCGRQNCTLLCRSALLILTLAMPTPWDLHILTCGTHFTVSLSEQPLRKPSVLWSKACSSAWHARMGRGHHLDGLHYVAGRPID